MLKIKGVLAGLSVGLSLVASPSHAALSDIVPAAYGAYASVNTASSCPSFCTGDFVFDTAGGEFATSASASEDTYGIGRASASFVAQATSLPQLRAYAAASPGRGASATAFASQLFGYSGADNHNVNLQIDLTGLVSGTGGSNSIGASVAVLVNQSGGWVADFGSMVFEAFGFPTDTLFLSLNEPGVPSATGSLNFSLNNGDVFYVITELRARSTGGVADAENTLNLTFGGVNGATGIVAVTAVPEPATYAMLLAGLGLLGWRARRAVRA